MGFLKRLFGETWGADEATKEQWRQEMRNSAVAKEFVEIIVKEWFGDTDAVGCLNLRKQRKSYSSYMLSVHSDIIYLELWGDEIRDSEGKWQRITDNDLGVKFSTVNMQDITNSVKRDALRTMILERLAQQPFLKVSGSNIYYNEKAKVSW